jgi:hypothetical protein
MWILSMDDRGVAPRPGMVREMADLLLASRAPTASVIWSNHITQEHQTNSIMTRKKLDPHEPPIETIIET